MDNEFRRQQRFERMVPVGDDRERNVCANCDYVAYENPKIVVGSVASFGGAVLLCRRAIEPRRGFWTLPAGYLEMGESVEQGALREAWEEARCRLTIDRILAVYSVPSISQVQILFRARLAKSEFSPGPESAAVELFGWEDIPWAGIAFPTVAWALQQWKEVEGRTDFPIFGNPIEGV